MFDSSFSQNLDSALPNTRRSEEETAEWLAAHEQRKIDNERNLCPTIDPKSSNPFASWKKPPPILNFFNKASEREKKKTETGSASSEKEPISKKKDERKKSKESSKSISSGKESVPKKRTRGKKEKNLLRVYRLGANRNQRKRNLAWKRRQ